MMNLSLRLVIGLALAGVITHPAFAFEFRSITEDIATLYDAPSAKSRKLYVISRDYPVEVLVPVEGWSKVREASGKLAWVETKALSDKRTIVINVACRYPPNSRRYSAARISSATKRGLRTSRV